MKNTDLVGMKEFSKIIGINYTYLSQLCVNAQGKESVTGSSPRFYYGLQMPYPIGRNFYAVRKKWNRNEVLKFKADLLEHELKSLE